MSFPRRKIVESRNVARTQARLTEMDRWQNAAPAAFSAIDPGGATSAIRARNKSPSAAIPVITPPPRAQAPPIEVLLPRLSPALLRTACFARGDRRRAPARGDAALIYPIARLRRAARGRDRRARSPPSHAGRRTP